MRRWGCGGCAVVLCCAMVQGLEAKTPQRKAALTPWEQAERGRERLEATPATARSKADYARAMDGFRAVYHDAPGDLHAPDSVYAVAELLADEGRRLHDAKSLKDAVGQYEFLRVQYPGCSLRVTALLAEAQIYENDLHDAASARERYTLLIKQYPRSTQLEEARAGLASLDAGRSRPRGGAARGDTAVVAAGGSEKAAEASASHNGAGTSSLGAMPVTGDADAKSEAPAVADPAVETRASAVQAESVSNTKPKNHGRMAQVTGIRHWSTPNYTRVAIDLGDDVTYEAARVPNPDRIYFDLHGTRLAQELVGKSFAVTDDGFLKTIRAAQFSNDMTRVVLDVNDVTEYSAFLLPNPYRLIIDIHGGSKGQGEPKQEIAAGGTPPQPVAGLTATANAETPAPRVAAAVKSTPGRPVPNTVATKSSNSFDVAALSAQPGRVEATSQPTSQPISAVVPSGQEGVAADAAAGAAAPTADATTPSTSTIKRTKRGKATKDASGAVPARAAVPTADGETSLVRALGLKIGRIVIDAGHGGHDSGTLGVDGIEEKDVVLDVALRLGKMLHDRLGSEIIYTRSDDTFIPLETRTAIANKAQADLFLSIHANSSSDPSARGVETYYLNFTTQIDALEVAARENAVSDQSIHQLSDLVKKIALKDKIAESREFASDVEASLYGGLQKGNVGLKDRGVKKAPFVVLIGANMPSILAEISFVTNPKDAQQLQQPEYRERVAESLYKGVAKYAGGLSATRVPTERAGK
jgi:N-acetylmuramoyl-L-alanine amidase